MTYVFKLTKWRTHVYFLPLIKGPANCCTSWSAACWDTASGDNFGHACEDCGGSPCDDACGYSSNDPAAPASEECRKCCIAADHAVDWACEGITFIFVKHY